MQYINLEQICQGFIGQVVTIFSTRELPSKATHHDLVTTGPDRFAVIVNEVGHIYIYDESKPETKNLIFSGYPVTAMCHQILATTGQMIQAPQALRILGLLDDHAMAIFCEDAINEGWMQKHEYEATALTLKTQPD